MKRESFIFYSSFFDSIENLGKDVQADILLALIRYGLRGEIDPTLKPVANALFLSFKPQIDKNNQKYLNGFKGGEHGAKGGRPNKRNPKETPKKPQRNPKETPNDNVNDNVNENDINSAHEEFSVNPAITNSDLFRKPIIPKYEEVERVFIQQGGTIEMAKKFFAKYEATEWFYNNSPIMKFSTLVPGFMEIWRRNSNRQPEVTERKRLKL